MKMFFIKRLLDVCLPAVSRCEEDFAYLASVYLYDSVHIDEACGGRLP